MMIIRELVTYAVNKIASGREEKNVRRENYEILRVLRVCVCVCDREAPIRVQGSLCGGISCFGEYARVLDEIIPI